MKTLYCFGDSNTWGYDPRSFMGMRYPKHVRWTGIIEANTGYRVINDGMNGRCIPESRMQIESIADCVMKYADDAVLLWIMLGTNDLLNNPVKGASYAAARMGAFLSAFMDLPSVAAIPDGMLRIRLISPPLLKKGTWVCSDNIIQQSLQLGSFMQEIAKKHGIDFTDAGKFDIPVLFDGAHFSEEGHRIFADEMLDVLNGQEDLLPKK